MGYAPHTITVSLESRDDELLIAVSLYASPRQSHDMHPPQAYYGTREALIVLDVDCF